MKTFTLHIIIGLILAIFYIENSYAQTTIYYQYDLAGNRVLRTISLSKSTQSVSIDTVHQTQTVSENPKVYTDSIDNKKILIYPNPTKGNITIDIEGYQQDAYSFICVFNLSGNMLKSEPITSSSSEIDLSYYPAGLYIIEIKLVGKTSVWKVIKD